MSRTLLLAVSPGEVWAAVEENGALRALRVLRAAAPGAVGAVYLGRVVAKRLELPAALVEIGLDRPAFLDARDADPKRGIAGMAEGAALIVEIVKSARADKAAGVRILRDSARRTAFADAARGASPPLRLDRATAPAVAAAKPLLEPVPDRIVTDDRAAFAELRGFLAREHPVLAPRLALHGEAAPLFEAAGLGEAIAAALSPRVALPCGGALHIETAHAATLIDVDGGPAAALAANREAAAAAARQIALRNLAGPIVIDFIGMKAPRDRERVADALQAALAADGVTAEVLGWTRLGHLELVRARRAAPLLELLCERAADGSWRKSALTLALEALRMAAREASAQPGRALAVVAHPDIAAVLAAGEGLAARRDFEARQGRALTIEADPRHAREAVDIVAR